ncbi:MAG: VOC family protein [Woeseiaceae bacterium]|nr:VOC family protein [Woeseiaceae bacterium]
MASTVKRTTLIVRDVKKSQQWYEDVLGMSVWMDTDFTLSGEGLAAGKAGDVTHLTIMQANDPVIGMIGLLQWVDPPMEAPAKIPTAVTYGNPTFVVEAEDAVASFEAAKELGTHVHSEPHEWSTRGADGRMKHFLSVSLFDPDGYFFEMNQVLRITDD